ncbi:hypothetical protein TRAPUB_9704 [Trametes pubescens]|uniref:Uncharacterized protein n=1 Tax=Trametes pubescens TaxID=154538 RepID=A0A1M2W1L3_TRAPU|nr:hypothetical protein TRAPUB_9704 [Trametes pubescens]
MSHSGTSRSPSPTPSARSQDDPVADDDVTDTSEDERTTKKVLGKQKSKARTPPPRGATRAKRMNWSLVPAALTYLNDQYTAWLLCTSQEEKKTIRNDCMEYVPATWKFPGYTDGDVRNNWFKNTKQLRRRNASAGGGCPNTGQVAGGNPVATVTTPLDVAPLLRKLKSRARSASSLWADDNTALINKHMSGNNPGKRKKVVKDLFDALPQEERDTWTAKAHKAKNMTANNPNAPFENQQNFPRALASLLHQLPGFGHTQIGAAIIHVRLAMRNIEGRVQCEQMTIGIDQDHPAFAEFEGGPDLTERGRWDRFITSALPLNPVRQDPRLIYGEDGRPLLPEFDNTWSGAHLASVLEAYFMAWWQHAKIEGPIDWTLLAEDPSGHLDGTWATGIIRDPSNLGLLDLAIMYGTILQAQHGPDAFRFKAQVPSCLPNASRAPSITPQTPSKIRVVRVFQTPKLSTPRRERPTCNDGVAPSALPSILEALKEDTEVNPTAIDSCTAVHTPSNSAALAVDAPPLEPTTAAVDASTAVKMTSDPTPLAADTGVLVPPAVDVFTMVKTPADAAPLAVASQTLVPMSAAAAAVDAWTAVETPSDATSATGLDVRNAEMLPPPSHPLPVTNQEPVGLADAPMEETSALRRGTRNRERNVTLGEPKLADAPAAARVTRKRTRDAVPAPEEPVPKRSARISAVSPALPETAKRGKAKKKAGKRR